MADYSELVKRLTTKAAMIELGEKIAWGSEIAAMRDAAAAIEALQRAVLAAEARGLERAAKVSESADTPVFKPGWSAGQDAAAISTMAAIATAIRALITPEMSKEQGNG